MKKVLILCPYSAPSACGVWIRAFADAKALREAGYEVHVFSSNIIKGTNKKSEKYELMDGVHIHRFKVLFSLGGTSMFWFFPLKFLKLKPDIIHTHIYRHPHSVGSLILGKILRKTVILTTHAPFEKDPRRNFLLKIYDGIYDLLIGRWELKLYNKIIRISKWEETYLNKLGVKENKTVYIPNGVNEKFLKEHEEIFCRKMGTTPLSGSLPVTFEPVPRKKILYMGRLDPVKRLEWLQYAAKECPEYKFKIVGPLSGYSKFESESENLDVDVRTYVAEEFIEELKQSDIYVLPSIREALSITTLEAMAMGVIPIVSNTNGPCDFIIDSENGYVVNSPDELVEKIQYIYNNWNTLESVRKKARETAENFNIKILSTKLVNLYANLH
jgi:glycosyltransferase involved in cell wall biosynthesis